MIYMPGITVKSLIKFRKKRQRLELEFSLMQEW